MFVVKPLQTNQPTLSLITSVLPKVTCDLPLQGASGVQHLKHIKDLSLADPFLDQPGEVDLLIGCNVLQDVLMSEIKRGNPEQPMAMKTIFGWAILRRYKLNSKFYSTHPTQVCSVTASLNSDDLLRQFWEIEESATSHQKCLTPEKQEVITHFKHNHVLLPVGWYEVTLPKKSNAPTLGESRAQAVNRYMANECSILRKGTYDKFQGVVQEYLDLNHAETVPTSEINKLVGKTYYLPMHAVTKESRTSTKLYLPSLKFWQIAVEACAGHWVQTGRGIPAATATLPYPGS